MAHNLAQFGIYISQNILALDKEHQKVFHNVSIAEFGNEKSLEDRLVRASLPILNNTLSSGLCGKRNCHVCQFIVNGDIAQ